MKMYSIEVCLYETETENDDGDLLLDSLICRTGEQGGEMWVDEQEAVQAYKSILEHIPSAYTVDRDSMLED